MWVSNTYTIFNLNKVTEHLDGIHKNNYAHTNHYSKFAVMSKPPFNVIYLYVSQS